MESAARSNGARFMHRSSGMYSGRCRIRLTVLKLRLSVILLYMQILTMNLTLSLLAVASLAIAADMPSEGSKAPDFTLSTQEGKTVSLHDFAGKWVVLYFYPKDMTQGCTIEAHNCERDLAQYDKKNAVILGVSEDSVDSHKQFCTKESLTFKLL